MSFPSGYIFLNVLWISLVYLHKHDFLLLYLCQPLHSADNFALTMSQEDGIASPGIYGTQIPDTIPLLPTQDVKIFRQIYGVPQPQGSTAASTVESDSNTCVQELQGEIEAIKARLEELMGTGSKVRAPPFGLSIGHSLPPGERRVW